MSCKYKDLFGKPGVGFHVHFLGIAIGDVIGTILLALLFAKILKMDFWLILLIIFSLGILLHKIFCVNTTINKFLFGEQK